ncbi:MAG: sensor histidine kinase [Prevotella sp.]|jgi:sensor histidine kinase YesM
MQVNSFLKNWAFYTLLDFALYELLWVLTDAESYIWRFQNSQIELLGDFIYCIFFSLLNLLFCVVPLSCFCKGDIISQKKLAGVVFLSLFANMGLAVIGEYIYDSLMLTEISQGDFWGSVYVFAFIAAFNTLLYSNHYYLKLVVSHYERSMDYKKRFLKAQLDPHFLFNSFNILAELTRTDARKAEEFTLRLSDIYRCVLKRLDSEFMSVKEGIEAAKSYIAVQNLRFGDCVILEVHDNGQLTNAYILPMSIQLLLENAIKHNRATDEQKLRISIVPEGDYLVVSNNLIPSDTDSSYRESSFGIGLKNLEESYLLETGKAPIVEKSDDEFIVKIPIIRK